eukprot:COSAG01_NODE_8068_length_2934_cov_2.512703_6_plen_66_part_01
MGAVAVRASLSGSSHSVSAPLNQHGTEKAAGSRQEENKSPKSLRRGGDNNRRDLRCPGPYDRHHVA